MRQCKGMFVLALALVGWAIANRMPAQSGVSPVPAMPGSTSPIFVPLVGWPRPSGYGPGGAGDPGPRPVNNPFVRQSGIFGFVDTMGTIDPNDDREYCLASRSDGIHIIDATPRSGVTLAGNWSPSASAVVVPAMNRVTFVEERDWEYFYPFSPSPGPGRQLPPGYPPGPMSTVPLARPFDDSMNGYSGGAWVASASYDPGMVHTFPFPYSSKNTTNRESVAWYDSVADKWFVYSASTLHRGIWIIPLRRNAVFGNLELDPALPDAWWYGSPSMTPPVGTLHSIYVDTARAQIWVCDDEHQRVRGFQLAGGGLPVLPPLLDISAPTPHDAMPAGDRLFVASTGSSQVTVFKLPISATGVTFSPITSAPGNVFGHSVYFDAAGGPGSLWVLSEAAATPSAPNIVNFERFAYSLNPVSSSPDAASSQALTYRIIPSGIVSPLSDIVHHIRGVGRTGFCANYNDGLSLLSLVPTGPGVQPVVLGSYDTSPRSRPVSGNAVQALVDKFDGTWDVFPGSPSGIVYASAGDLGVVAFKVTQGHINRYWNATPFPVGGCGRGIVPIHCIPVRSGARGDPICP